MIGKAASRSALHACVLGLLLLVGACGSQPATLYRPCGPDGSGLELHDGEIRMVTRWTNATDEIPDVRVIASEGGRITCSFENSSGRREGYVSESDWNGLWTRLEAVSPWASPPPSIKPQDPNGGPYHLVHMRAGTSVSQFSSQHRADLLVFTSREAASRLEFSNAIVDFVASRARMRVEPAVTPTESGAPASRP